MLRMVKMPGAEDEGAGSVLKYMTKPESDGNATDWLFSRTAKGYVCGHASTVTFASFTATTTRGVPGLMNAPDDLTSTCFPLMRALPISA